MKSVSAHGVAVDGQQLEVDSPAWEHHPPARPKAEIHRRHAHCARPDPSTRPARSSAATAQRRSVWIRFRCLLRGTPRPAPPFFCALASGSPRPPVAAASGGLFSLSALYPPPRPIAGPRPPFPAPPLCDGPPLPAPASDRSSGRRRPHVGTTQANG